MTTFCFKCWFGNKTKLPLSLNLVIITKEEIRRDEENAYANKSYWRIWSWLPNCKTYRQGYYE